MNINKNMFTYIIMEIKDLVTPLIVSFALMKFQPKKYMDKLVFLMVVLASLFAITKDIKKAIIFVCVSYIFYNIILTNIPQLKNIIKEKFHDDDGDSDDSDDSDDDSDDESQDGESNDEDSSSEEGESDSSSSDDSSDEE